MFRTKVHLKPGVLPCLMICTLVACSQLSGQGGVGAGRKPIKKEAVVRFRGGGEIGHMRSSWPFVTLDISDDEICLSIVLRKAVIERRSVQKIVCEKGPAYSAIIVRHNDPQKKANLQFWTASPDEVMSQLRAMGYPCE
jgi:hypothetical protein